MEFGEHGEGDGGSARQISGRIIIEQLIRNMELGQFEMAYSILTPCIFSLYLHPEDYARLPGVFELIRDDAKKALEARLAGQARDHLERGGSPVGKSTWTYSRHPAIESLGSSNKIARLR